MSTVVFNRSSSATAAAIPGLTEGLPYPLFGCSGLNHPAITSRAPSRFREQQASWGKLPIITKVIFPA